MKCRKCGGTMYTYTIINRNTIQAFCNTCPEAVEIDPEGNITNIKRGEKYICPY